MHLRGELLLEPGTKTYKNWIVNRHPYYFDIYIFNWTNSEDLFNRSIKPKFQELGPYRHELFLEKHNVTVNKNGTVTYYYAKKYTFVKQDGTRPMTDRIITLNPVANAVAYQFRHGNMFVKMAASFVLRTFEADMVITKTANELLFDGYHDPIIDAIKKTPLLSNMYEADKFGYFYKRNYTDLLMGPINVNSLVDENVGNINYYRNRTSTGFYSGSCGAVTGNLGEFVEMSRNTNKSLTLFVLELSKFLTMRYKREENVEGLKCNRYEPGIEVFDNGTYQSDYKCFCNGECVPSGLLNASSSYNNAPMFFSMPHFYLADPYYTEAINGIKQSSEDDQVFVSYEPFTGVLVKVGLKTQLNMLLQPIKGIGMYSDVPKYFIPVLYINQTVILNDYIIDELKLVQIAPVINYYFSLCALVIGGLMMFAFMQSNPICNKKKMDTKIYDALNGNSKRAHSI